VGTGPQEFRHLGLEDFLESFFHQGFHPIPVFRHQARTLRSIGLALCCLTVMVWSLRRDLGLISAISLMP
jgi:hypothetical protein